MHEALESSDWATRKAAAETLTRVGNNLGPALSSFRSETLQVLESCRFDKVGAFGLIWILYVLYFICLYMHPF
jgi:hypothetical protein